MEYACRSCHRILEKNYCPYCRSSSTSRNWSGFLLIIDPQRSQIAKKLGITAPGRYALKVR